MGKFSHSCLIHQHHSPPSSSLLCRRTYTATTTIITSAHDSTHVTFVLDPASSGKIFFVLHGHGVWRIKKRRLGEALPGIEGSPPTILVHNVTKRGPPHRASYWALKQHSIASSRRYTFWLCAFCSASTVHICVTAMTISNEI